MHFISSFENTSSKNFKIQPPFLLFRAVLHQLLQNPLSIKVFGRHSLMGEANFLQALMVPEYWEALE